jgi:hypothetical protein
MGSSFKSGTFPALRHAKTESPTTNASEKISHAVNPVARRRNIKSSAMLALNAIAAVNAIHQNGNTEGKADIISFSLTLKMNYLAVI